ncbi:hypothetical protein [Galactobacter sp.]|uniref:hypothetical protein n=1 Tax=Galactobacter sp. TaxID=2676125 RepID=UPI0025C22750|nr:hypothetical protein [Galactobacter sp.]
MEVHGYFTNEAVEQIRAIVREELAAQAEREKAERERKPGELVPVVKALAESLAEYERISVSILMTGSEE